MILGTAFYLAANWTLGVVGDSLLQETVSVRASEVSRLSVSLSERLSGSVDAFYLDLTEAARQLGGRLLIVDPDDKVTFDTANERCGTVLPLAEAVTVLRGERDTDYGYHQVKGERDEGRWEGCFVSSLLDRNGRLSGALIFIASVQATVDQVLNLRDRMLTVFVTAAVGVLLMAALLSGLITRPVGALSEGIERMGRGDYGTPVHVRGRGEMANLAAAFNDMSEKVRSLDETRSQFVANASHELKTPLATIKILVESMLYEEDMEEETRKEFLGDINREIDRLSSVVGDLLTLARIDSRKLTLTREPMSLSDVAEETAQSLRPLAEKQGIILTVEAEDPCLLEGDANRLRQVCYNLISNAVKYTPEGGEVRIALQRSGRDVVLIVKDTGIGIAEEDLPHIFERFYRADKARSRVGETGGTGLGLSIVRQIVRLHGGTVTVRSQLGEGTEFTVLLPALSGKGE
ncbi:MAG: HAMP domain-containing histidine kinase [Clostridiales bacterium]|nr:HAMP domain-containing histidine kinase [Clostridiales bacterium]